MARNSRQHLTATWQWSRLGWFVVLLKSEELNMIRWGPPDINVDRNLVESIEIPIMSTRYLMPWSGQWQISNPIRYQLDDLMGPHTNNGQEQSYNRLGGVELSHSDSFVERGVWEGGGAGIETTLDKTTQIAMWMDKWITVWLTTRAARRCGDNSSTTTTSIV